MDGDAWRKRVVFGWQKAVFETGIRGGMIMII